MCTERMDFETLQVVSFIHYVHVDVGSFPVASTTSTSISKHPNSFQHPNKSTQRNITVSNLSRQDAAQSTVFDARKLSAASLHRSSIPALFPKALNLQIQLFGAVSTPVPDVFPTSNLRFQCPPELHSFSCHAIKKKQPLGSPLSRGVACVLCMQSLPMASS